MYMVSQGHLFSYWGGVMYTVSHSHLLGRCHVCGESGSRIGAVSCTW